MGIVSDQLLNLEDEFSERSEVKEFRAIAMEMTNTMLEGLTRMNDIKTGGNDFNTIPTETKAVFLRWESAFKDLKTLLLADAEIVECYQWRP